MKTAFTKMSGTCVLSFCPGSFPPPSGLLLLEGVPQGHRLLAALTPCSLPELWISVTATCCSLPSVSPQVQTLWNPTIYSTSPLDDYYPSQTLCVWDWTPYFTLQICSIQRDFPSQLIAPPFCQGLSPKIFVSLIPPSQLENHIDSTFTIFPKSDYFLTSPLPRAVSGSLSDLLPCSCNWLYPCIFHRLFSTDGRSDALKCCPVCLPSAQNLPMASCFTQSKKLWPHRSLKVNSWSDPINSLAAFPTTSLPVGFLTVTVLAISFNTPGVLLV